MPSLDASTIEIIDPHAPRGRLRLALFDFDGTLSLLRGGWEDVMVAMMVEALRAAPRHEGEPELRALVTGFVRDLTGEPTIMQTQRLVAEVALRGGAPVDPEAFKQAYLARLSIRIEARRSALAEGGLANADLLVEGAREFLKVLRARGVICYLASGTDEVFVQDEAALLGLSGYFAGIFGARPGDARPIKQLVIERVLRDHALRPGEWAAFGDGVAEIRYARQAGGLAVGLATVEAGRGGLSAWKRQRLIDAGAQLILPDFSAHAALATYLLAEA